jgi:PPOX class probable F420-dependent enzyme
MDLPEPALMHLESDHIAWLSTVTNSGRPFPAPVWFVPDGDEIVVFSEPRARKIANLERSALASFHFNSDPDGQDIVVVSVDAVAVTHGQRPTAMGAYLAKYERSIAAIGLTLEEYDATFTTAIRLRPTGVWLGPE